MDDVLKIWLRNDIPESTLELSRCILALSILYQFSTGLMSAIQATGNIKNYQITMGCLILTNIPIAYYILKLGYPIYYVTVGFIMIEAISLVVRIYMAKAIAGISPMDFVKNVIIPCIVICAIPSVCSIVPYMMINETWPRLIVVSATYGIMYILLTWLFALDKLQRVAVVNKIKSKMHG